MNKDHRVVIITGATGGLGRIAAKQFAAQGASLALISTSAEKLEQLAEELSLVEDRIMTYTADLGQAAAVQEMAGRVLAKYGRADVLLHLVGGWSGGRPLVEEEPQKVSGMLQQHLWTTFYMAQVFLPGMLSHHWGRILIITSPSAAHPPAHAAPYAIGKAAQEALLLTIAQEVKESGVTANMLVVKKIDTTHERTGQPTPQNASWTTPEEISAALLYLCSDEAGMVNGARIPLFRGP
jgi:NAD(P)-dependent dehydrogenase (short-subunit alcohol dehydrogenase family)